MKVNDLLLELDLKTAAKKSGLADLHAKQQEKKRNEFNSKYNNGMPVKVKVKVYVKKPAYKQEDPYEFREFTIDNLIDIRHKLDGITLIDMSSVEDDKSKHDGKATWAIKKDGKQLPGGLPEYLHGLPARTRKKNGTNPYDLRRETWTDTPLPYNSTHESVKVAEEGEGGEGEGASVEASLARPNKKFKKILFKKPAPQMDPFIRKKKADE